MTSIRRFVIALMIVVALGPDAATAQWVRTNGPFSGMVRCLVTQADTLYAGTLGEGVFRTANNGTSWKAINDGLPNLSINSLCFKGTYLFAGTGGGIFRSSDGGAAWSQVNNGLTSTNVRAVETDGSFLFAATDEGGICRSTDDGANWAPVNNGLLTNVAYYSLAVVPDPAGSRGHAILAGSGIGAHRSRNDGGSWEYIPNGLTSPWPVTVVYGFAAHPTADHTGVSDLYAATNGGVFRSIDYGSNWSAASNGLSSLSVGSIASGGLSIFGGTLGGACVSTDSGASWEPLRIGLTDTLISSLTVKGTSLFAGTINGAVWIRPLIAATPESLEFGPTTRDSTTPLTVSLRNISQAGLTIDSMRVGTERFEVVSVRHALAPDDTMHVTVRFRPDVYGQHYDTLSLHSNDLASQAWIPLKGVSPPPLIEVASPMLTLGPVALGDTVRDVVTIRNRSVANRLTISQIHSQSPAFAAEATLPLVIRANDSAVVTVRFSTLDIPPEGFGTLRDTLSIDSDGGNSTVALLGRLPVRSSSPIRPVLSLLRSVPPIRFWRS